MRRALGAILVIALLAAGIWQYRRMHQARTPDSPAATTAATALLDELFSQNPRDVEKATAEITRLGPVAVAAIQAALRDPQAEAERLKGALKAAGILGKTAAPAVAEVAAVLEEQGLTAEAAIALSHMGPDAFPPLRDALDSADPVVRREALRSIGKMKDRAPLDLDVVLPLLIEGMKDPDEGVRAVAATYLGIIHEGPDTAIPALTAGLSDPDPEVRRASAAALGSFGSVAAPALPALRIAAADKNTDVASEAGRTIVKLQQK
jgi:HEAT repeat protein